LSELFWTVVGRVASEGVHESCALVGDVGTAVKFCGGCKLGSMTATVALTLTEELPLVAVAWIVLASPTVVGKRT
jgi:hypothetical protein